jgi:hypothetical protein
MSGSKTSGSTTTALVALTAAERETQEPAGQNRPRADFLAQLIAAKVQAPQTRLRRRAEPDVAIAAYDAQTLPPASAGGAFRRSL